VGLGLFLTLVTAFTAVCGIQILIQVWAPDAPETDLGCHEGILALQQALYRARDAASTAAGGERAALSRFRATLRPEWDFRATITQRCAGDPEALRSLVVLDKLRYAEENAVRYEATSLAALRRRGRQLGASADSGP
jgi:hypothetical protein